MKKNLIFTRFFFYFRFVLVRRSCWCLCGCFFFSPETNARRIYVSRIFCTSHTHELQRQARKTNHASQQDKTHTSTVCRTHKVFQHHRNTKEKCCRIFKCNKSSETYEHRHEELFSSWKNFNHIKIFPCNVSNSEFISS